jgi:chromosome segregation ATPase
MSEEDLKARIKELEKELESKQREIYEHLDRIEQLEDNVMKLEALIPDEDQEITKRSGKKTKETKLMIDLENKDKTIRDLKDKMGFLRKDKVQLEQELEKYTRKKSDSIVIRIEDKKEPFEILVKDLQDKIIKQNILIKEQEQQIILEKAKHLKDESIKFNQNIISLKNYSPENKDDLNNNREINEKTRGELNNDLSQQKILIENLKKLINFKNDIINELINHFNANLSVLKDTTLELKIRNLQSLNDKLSKHMEQFQ